MNECGPDGCPVDIDALIEAKAKADREAGERAAKEKLDRWLRRLGAYDDEPEAP